MDYLFHFQIPKMVETTHHWIFQIVLATAAPDKFPEAVELAGISYQPKPSITKLLSMETR